jgi:polysaccharide export outer membrane protein
MRPQACRPRHLAAAALALTLLGGGMAKAETDAPTSPAPQSGLAPATDEYRIGPLDELDITVFEVKDLTLQKVQVDASGHLVLPLVGLLTAQGKTTSELSDEIASRLAARYLQSPQVSVVVEESASQKVTVEGAVTEAGVFQMRGRTSLMEAIAMAKGTSRDANLRRVAIIRTVDGQPHAAVFNLAQIYAGKSPDPEILGSDTVVVDTSGSKYFWDEVVRALPALSVLAFVHP